jgi:hypothetical protein
MTTSSGPIWDRLLAGQLLRLNPLTVFFSGFWCSIFEINSYRFQNGFGSIANAAKTPVRLQCQADYKSSIAKMERSLSGF